MRAKLGSSLTRRDVLKLAGLSAGAAAAAPLISACGSIAGPTTTGPLKLGVLLPFSDIYAVLGESIRDAMELYFEEVNNEAGGRKIEMVLEDTEVQPDVGQQRARKLVEQDQVDLLTGVVSSGVAMGLRDYIHSSQTLMLMSNAGANPLSRDRITPYIWRTSYTNWMPNWPVGKWAAENVGTRAYVSVPDYAAGDNVYTSFENSFTANGGEIIDVQRTPFPNMGDPAPFLAEIADAEPDLVYAFYAGSASVNFVKAYGEFGLAGQLPLMGPGFLVEQDVLPQQGEAALGVRSGMHWALSLDNEANLHFTEAYREKTGRDANVYAMQGYDTARVIVELMNLMEGDTSDVDRMIEALEGISFDSPRGAFALDAASQAPRHNIYLREVQMVDGTPTNVVTQDLGEIVDPGDNSKG